MKEADLTKLARWIVPGWISILAFYCLVLVDMLFSTPGASRLFPDFNQFLAQYSDLSGILITIVIGATGVPIGFSIYQIYFFLRWNSPFSRDGLIPPMISGRMQDLERSMAGIELSDLTNRTEWKEALVTDPLFQRDHGIRWRFIENSFNEAVQVLDSNHSAVSIYAKHRYLHEVTHTLGASIIAIYLGFLGYFALKVSVEKLNLSLYLLISFVLGGILFYFLNREDDFRQQLKFSEKILNSQSMKKVVSEDPTPTFSLSVKIPLIKRTFDASVTHPSSLFAFGLLMVHFFNNPIFNSNVSKYDFLFKIGVTIFLIVLWLSSRNKMSFAYKVGDGIGLTLSFLLSISLYYAPAHYKDWIDWSYFSTISIFLAAMLIFYKNRQNAKDDMLALENYTLKRCLVNDKDRKIAKGS